MSHVELAKSGHKILKGEMSLVGQALLEVEEMLLCDILPLKEL